MLIAVTNRKLCREDFLRRIEKIAQGRPDAVILREKDLSLPEYLELFQKCENICRAYNVPVVANLYIEATEISFNRCIQLSFSQFIELQDTLTNMKEIGVSIHHVKEAVKLKGSRAARLIAGHIFSTECKKGIPPRGLDFLQEVCKATDLPVYAIGGINYTRAQQVMECGCSGFCVMSELMTCTDPMKTVQAYQALPQYLSNNS